MQAIVSRCVCRRFFLTERLVVEKGPRQRRIEGYLYLVIPPLIGALCWHYLGSGVWQIPAILIALIAMSLIGNAIAIRLGGELMSPTERWRRGLARIAEQPLPLLLFWMFLLYFLLFLSMLLPMVRANDVPHEIPFMLGITLPGSAICSGLCAYYLRSQASTAAASVQSPLSLQAPWPWLAASLRFRLIGLLGLVGGYLVGRGLSFSLSLVALLAGSWLGLIVETAVKNRFAKPGPVLWHNFSFPAALATGASLQGIYFAVFFGFMALLTPETADEHSQIIVVSIFALAGFFAGVLFALIPWALARFNSVKADG
jgi:hypothetical protein